MNATILRRMKGQGVGHLDGLAVMTQQQVAKILGLSRSRVAQIEYEALRKLRLRLAEVLKEEGIELRSN